MRMLLSCLLLVLTGTFTTYVYLGWQLDEQDRVERRSGRPMWELRADGNHVTVSAFMSEDDMCVPG